MPFEWRMRKKIDLDFSLTMPPNKPYQPIMASSCDICCEHFNKTTHQAVKCMYTECEFRACKACMRQYILSSTGEAHCMSCKKAWPTNFLVMNLNRSFVDKEYAEHKKKLLLEREVSKLPDTMETAQISKEHKDKSKEERTKAKKYINEMVDLEKQIQELTLKKQEQETMANRHLRASERHKRNALRPGAAENTTGAADAEKKEKKRFIMPCPGAECRGFLSTQYKCELCSIHACPKCFEIIGTDKNVEHTCNEDNVKSAEMIRKDTKPCPACGTRISKIDGCDQMWCVECHTAFSWNTGKIDNGRVHNPHFYQHKRNQNNGMIPRAPGDVLCGGLCNVDQLEAGICNKMKHEEGDSVYIRETHRLPGRRRHAEAYHIHYHHNRVVVYGNVLMEVEGVHGPGHVIIDFKREDVNDCSHCRGPCYANKWKGTQEVRKNLVRSTKQDELLILHQFVTHITYDSLPTARRRAADDDHENTNKMLRVAYILGDLSKEELASQVYVIEKKKEQQVELLHIYELLSVVGIELFTNMSNSTNQGAEFNRELKEQLGNYRTLCDYCNEQFANISISYHVKVDQIDENWKVKPQKFSVRNARKGKGKSAAAQAPAAPQAPAAAS